MSDWTKMLAAQNWCDQFQRNGGRIEWASEGYMNSGLSSFSWDRTPEGCELWYERYMYFRDSRELKNKELCR